MTRTRRVAAVLAVLALTLTLAAPAQAWHRRYIRAYVDAPTSQATIDRCQLDLWGKRPLWLAGHNYCGFAWFARLRWHDQVIVTRGPARGRFLVVGRLVLPGHIRVAPVVTAGLVLQTCVGHSTSLTLLRRL